MYLSDDLLSNKQSIITEGVIEYYQERDKKDYENLDNLLELRNRERKLSDNTLNYDHK